MAKREHGMRLNIWLLILCFALLDGVLPGEAYLNYLYLRWSLDFTLSKFTTFSIIMGVASLFSQYTVVPLLAEKFKLRDSVLLMICMAGFILMHVTLAAATEEWMVYLAAAFAILDFNPWAITRLK